MTFLLVISWIQPDSLINPDFSGKWVLNKDKSAQFLQEGNVSFELDISQYGINMNIQKIFDFTDGEPLKRLDSYKLDSKGVITETDKMIQTVAAGWSPDGQSFLVTTKINYKKDSSKNSKRIETYSLSNDQKTLIINYNDILPESSITPFQERIFNMIYDKSNL